MGPVTLSVKTRERLGAPTSTNAGGDLVVILNVAGVLDYELRPLDLKIPGTFDHL